MDILDLSDFFKTKTESINFSTRLLGITEKIYTTDFDLEKSLLEEFGMSKKDKLATLLINNKVNINSKSDLGNFFTKVIEKINALSTLSITMAIEPDEKTMEKLSQWFVLNTKKQFLFDFKIDPTLIAGAEIMVNGKHLNFSIREKFDEILKAEIANISKTPNLNSQNSENDKTKGNNNIQQIPSNS